MQFMERLAFLLSWILQLAILQIQEHQTWSDRSLLLAFRFPLFSIVEALYRPP